jgi:hypothetical protein
MFLVSEQRTTALSHRKSENVTKGGKSEGMNFSFDTCSCHNLSSEGYSSETTTSMCEVRVRSLGNALFPRIVT